MEAVLFGHLAVKTRVQWGLEGQELVGDYEGGLAGAVQPTRRQRARVGTAAPVAVASFAVHRPALKKFHTLWINVG